jgi:hypothetical protein
MARVIGKRSSLIKMNKWARLPYSLQMALSFNWIGLSTTNARIGVRIPVGLLDFFVLYVIFIIKDITYGKKSKKYTLHI